MKKSVKANTYKPKRKKRKGRHSKQDKNTYKGQGR
jgi:hypothetical protein